MNKIYQTRLGNLSTSVVVNGVPRRVQFRAWDGVNGLFSTEDEALQQALEQSRGYGRRFVLMEIPDTRVEQETYQLVPGIRSWQAARDYLRQEPYGLSDEEVSTPALIEQAAERFHLVFTQLKKKKRR
ncbi:MULTISPECIES: hypothetical protein [unclassified Barnesiella]|uniref:hypothetical protein n=1 Tax=unclassified Barnesiella TaxID=2645177 RepID=UPI000B37885E|nr:MULTISPECIES: hypothetical protein [unclassified Barnesiella]MCR8912500.1 hypothetical protein [Barnesiella sp. ET7]OUO97655.1 hypothetical protein B5F38_09125 [Barnesiella sp. An22]HJB73334.1 hypothetical protein [Candidatus Barnesiella merdigallinarum]